MNGGTSPFIVVFLIMRTEAIATTIPKRYIQSVIKSGFGKLNTSAIPPAIAVKIGNLAPQLKKGITRIVAVLSLSSANVLVLIIAGTEQPKPIIIGMNARPDNPNLLKILSRIKAIRAIYPLSSRIEKNKNNNKICGKNERTLDKPAKTPSQIKPLTHAGAEILSSPIPTSSVIQSVNIPSNDWRNTPIELIPPLANKPSNLVPSANINPSSPKAPMALR